uniref:Uncharacterized protein n=1 Tax=Oryza nivara TaxID=4536 RepID=A0A0E0GXQ1_ORYNI
MGHARLHFLLFLVSASADCLLRPPLRLRRMPPPPRLPQGKEEALLAAMCELSVLLLRVLEQTLES